MGVVGGVGWGGIGLNFNRDRDGRTNVKLSSLLENGENVLKNAIPI